METKKKRGEKEERMHLGLIYDVKRQKFDMVYKDLMTNEIRIDPSHDKEGQEVNTSVSAA